MDTAQHPRVTEGDWLAASPIGPHAVAFKRHLTERRYAAHTVSSYVAEVTHFARWACTRRLPLARIDEVSVAIFLDDHLPSCACTGQMRHDRADHSAALGHLLVVLRAQGAIAQPPVSTTPVDEELRRYDDHMNHVRGLAPKSRTAYFSDRGRPFQSDRGRCFSVIVDGLGRHASPGLNVAQSSTISLKWPAVALASVPVLGVD